MKKHLILPTAFLLLTVSCKKDKEESCPTTMESIAGSYKLISFTVAGVDAIDFYFDECEKDNVVVLDANGTYEFVDAGVQCSPPGTSTGDWSLSGNQFSIDLLPQTLTLDKFDCTNLSGSAMASGTEVKATFRRQ